MDESDITGYEKIHLLVISCIVENGFVYFMETTKEKNDLHTNLWQDTCRSHI